MGKGLGLRVGELVAGADVAFPGTSAEEEQHDPDPGPSVGDYARRQVRVAEGFKRSLSRSAVHFEA